MNWGLYNDHTLVSHHNTYIEALETALSQHKQNGAEYDVKPTEQPAEPQKRPVYIKTADRQYDMSNLQLSAVAVTDDGIVKHKEPVSSIDDAKQKLDALNVGMPPVYGRYHGQIVPLNNPEVSVWVSPEFEVSHLDEYFQLLKENGGYTTHAEYELAKSGWVYTGDQRKDGF